MNNIKLRNWIPGQARNDMRFGIMIFLVFVLICIASLSYAVTVPQLINYTGTLTNSGGSPVPNGNYSIEFRIYSAASGGVALWTEKWDTTTSQVTVVNGVFNVMLGGIDPQVNPIPSSFFQDNSTTYLGIKVGTDSEMTPRQRITSVGYAFSAYNGVPKGGIIMWSGAVAQIPSGWALCDGSNGTPNLRDRFIVGWDGTSPRTGGSTTINLAHSHTINATDTNHTHNDDHTHNYNHSHYVSRVNDGSQPSETGHGLDQGGDYAGVTWYDGTRTTNSKSAQGNGSTTGYMNQNASHSHSENSQLSGAQDIRPPYYALAFIMKI